MEKIKYNWETNSTNIPVNIYFEITDFCPLKCNQCYCEEGQRFMELGDFRKYIEQMDELNSKRVILIGGEPFAHKDFYKMIDICKEKGLFVVTSTSGYYITDNSINKLKECKNLAIYLSLNGSKEKINSYSRDGYSQVMNAIKLLSVNNISFNINWVAREDNVYDFPDLLKIIEKYNVYSLNIIKNKPSFLTNTIDSKIKEEGIAFLKKQIDNYNGSAILTIDPCYKELSDFSRKLRNNKVIANNVNGCTALKTQMVISLNNEIKPCTHLDSIFKIEKMSLKECWVCNEAIRFRNTKVFKNLCDDI